MSAVPVLGQPMESFQVTAQAKMSGFQSFSLFPSKMQHRVAAVIGLGILTHMYMEYPAIKSWLSSMWSQQRASLVINYLEQAIKQDASHNGDPSFWSGLASKVMEIAEDLCVRYECPQLYFAASRKEDLTLDVRDPLLRLLCEYLCIDLVLLKKTDRGLLQETTRNEDRVGLLLFVAEETDAVLFLYHKLSYAADIENLNGFPFFLEPHSPIPRFSGFECVVEDMASAVENTVDALEEATSILCDLLEDDSSSRFNELIELQKIYRKFEDTMALYNLPVSEVIQRLKLLKPPHPLHMCKDVGGDLFTLRDCGHKFHHECMMKYLSTAMENVILGYTEVFTCPVCFAQISEANLYQLSPSFYESFREKLETANERITTFTSDVSCRKCLQSVSTDHILYHRSNHSVCIGCLEQLQHCPVCGEELSEEERTWVEQAAHFVRSRE